MHTLLDTKQLFKTKEVKEKAKEKLAKSKATLSAICSFLDMQYHAARVKPNETVRYPFMDEYSDQVLKIAPKASHRYSWQMTIMPERDSAEILQPVGFDAPIKPEDLCQSETECTDRLRYNESVMQAIETAVDVLAMEAFLSALEVTKGETVELPIAVAIELGIKNEKDD